MKPAIIGWIVCITVSFAASLYFIMNSSPLSLLCGAVAFYGFYRLIILFERPLGGPRVRISVNGRSIMQDKELANRIINAIATSGESLDEGEQIQIAYKGRIIIISSV